MALFTRNLIETISIQDFLILDSNMKVGQSSSSSLLLLESNTGQSRFFQVFNPLNAPQIPGQPSATQQLGFAVSRDLVENLTFSDSVIQQSTFSKNLPETIQIIDDVRLFKNKACIDMDNFNGSLADWTLDQTDGTTQTNGGFLEISRTVAASFDDLGLLRNLLVSGRTNLQWELDVKFDSTNSEVLFGVTQENTLDRTEEVGIFFDDDGNVKIRDKGTIIGAQVYANDVWYTIRITENGAGALIGSIQGGAYGSETTIGTSTTTGFDDDSLQYRLAINARKLNLNDGNDLVFVENYDLCRPFGLVTRGVTEPSVFFKDRVGVSQGVFFRSDPSTLVTANGEIRVLTTVPDAGEIAVSRRTVSLPNKLLRFIPGTTLISPNQSDLGAISSDTGDQGWILEDSPAGVLLRGAWQVKLMVQDTLVEGDYRLHVSLFTVTHSTTGVQKVLKIGITQVTSPITPTLTPTQYTLDWTQAEAGEHFINEDESLYVEVFLEELSKPTSFDAHSKMLLDDNLSTLFSQLSFPGVTDEPTYSLAPPAESLTFSDSVDGVVGLNRELIETLTFSDVLTRNIAFQRDIVCPPGQINISDSVKAGKNVLFETIGPVLESLDIEQVLFRTFMETLPISDTLDVSGSFTKILVERIPIQDTLSGYINRPERKRITDGVDKRKLDGISADRLSNTQ